MPEKIEEILRAIHVLFSKGEMYHELPDKVVLSKREMFALLEQLNYAVVEVMDRYEATTRSKQKALQEVEAAGNRIIDAANKEAEDIYAASILYTDGALNEFTNIVDNTRQRLRDEYAYFEECMNQQLEQVRSNQTELLERLQVLAQNKKYLDIINQFATEEEERTESVVKEGKKTGGKGSKKKEIPPDTIIPEKFKKNGKGSGQETIPVKKSALPEVEEEVWEDAPARQKVEVKVHTGGGIPENSIFNGNLAKTKKERDREEKYGKAKANDGDGIQLSPEDIELSDEEIYFSSEQLDAEHEQWTQEQAAQGTQAEAERPEKGFGNFLNRLKNKK